MSASALSVGAALAVAIVLVARRVAPTLTSPARLPAVVDAESPIRLIRRRWRPNGGRQRAVRPDEEAVAGWCRRVAAGLRSGRSMSSAVVDADQGVVSPFPDVAHAVTRGRPLGDAFRVTRDDPSTPVGLAAPVLATCAELGGPAAGAIDHVADVLMARSTARQERRTAAAQARLSAAVLTIVPLGVVVLLTLVEPSIRRTIATPAGAVCIVAGAALDGLGWTWMRRMIGGAR